MFAAAALVSAAYVLSAEQQAPRVRPVQRARQVRQERQVRPVQRVRQVRQVRQNTQHMGTLRRYFFLFSYNERLRYRFRLGGTAAVGDHAANSLCERRNILPYGGNTAEFKPFVVVEGNKFDLLFAVFYIR